MLYLLIAVFWAVLHTLQHFHIPPFRPPSQSLPSNVSLQPRSHSTRLTRYTTLTLRPLYLHVSTTAFNTRHAVLASDLAARPTLQRTLVCLYDAGSALALLGIAGALGLLVCTARALAAGLAVPHGGAEGMVKRSDIDVGGDYQSPIHMLIPGVTLPLSHLPLLVSALFAAQVIHEAGHAIAAAFIPLPLYALAFSLTLVLPAASTILPAFPSSLTPPSPSDNHPYLPLSSDARPPFADPPTQRTQARARLRLAAAGAFHNLLLWVLLSAVPWAHVPWRDISAIGRVIVAVAEDSPLATHLPPGALITALDDTPLALPLSAASSSPPHSPSLFSAFFTFLNPVPPSDPWTAYLSAPDEGGDATALGWCVPHAVFDVGTTTCCAHNPPATYHTTPLACFIPLRAYAPSTAVETNTGNDANVGDDINIGNDIDHGRCLDPTLLALYPRDRFDILPAAHADPLSPSSSPSVGPLSLPVSAFPTLSPSTSRLPDPASHVPRTDHLVRCTAPHDCGPSALCVRPRASTRLLRISIHIPILAIKDTGKGTRENGSKEGYERDDGKDRIILWSGPRSEVLEAVRVSTLIPRHWLIPFELPLITAFFMYLRLITLSLYFFNLVPLPLLDGTHVLAAALDMLFVLAPIRADIYDLEAGFTTRPDAGTRIYLPTSWKPRIQRTIHACAAFLTAGCIVLGALTAIRS